MHKAHLYDKDSKIQKPQHSMSMCRSSRTKHGRHKHSRTNSCNNYLQWMWEFHVYNMYRSCVTLQSKHPTTSFTDKTLHETNTENYSSLTNLINKTTNNYNSCCKQLTKW